MATRRERVILDLEDNFSSGMARAAATTAVLDKQLNSLSKTAVRSDAGLQRTNRTVDNLGSSSRKTGADIDRLSGRLRLFADVAAVLGPSLIPIGAVALPAVTGLANQFGFAAIAAGSAIFAFQGIGDTLKAVNAAALEPTAENLKKARDAMQALSPAGRDLVRELQDLRPLITGLKDTAQGGLFPGVIEGLESLERLSPRVNSLLRVVSDTVGDLFAEGAESLASDRWSDFFSMLIVEARPTLTEMASAIGSVVHGLSEMWEAFAPLNRDFGSWLADSAAGFDTWAEGLSQTAGFQEFVDYIRDNGPQVADTAAAIGNALVQIVQAVAPLGGPSLQIIETFAKVLGAIADSDIGTPIFAGVAALAALNRTLAITGALQTRMTGSTALTAGLAGGGIAGVYKAGTTSVREFTNALLHVPTAQERALRGTQKQIDAERQRQAALRNGLSTMGKSAALVGGLAVVTTGLGDSMGVTNTASLALMGTLAGPWGTALGAGVGLALDLAAANDGITASLERLKAAVPPATGLAEFQGALSATRPELSAYARDVENFDGAILGLGDSFLGLPELKNSIEGLFGESDADEARAEFEAIEAQMAVTEGAARDLAAAMGVDLFGTQAAQLQQLDAVLQEVQPAMARMGITMQDWQNAAVSQSAAQGFKQLFGKGSWLVPKGSLHSLDQLNHAIARGSREIDKVARRKIKIQQLNAALREQRNAAQQAARGFVDLGREAKASEFTLDGWLDKLEKQTAAMRRFRQNAIAAGQRGLRQGLIRHLRELGPEGALQLAKLANASEKELKRANRWWDAYAREGKRANQTVGEMVEQASRRAKAAFNKLPKDVKTEIRATRIPETTAEINRLVEKYKLTEKERKALVSLTDNASGRIQDVLGLLARADGAHAVSTITTYVDTVRRNFGSSPVGNSGNQYADDEKADGGTVPGQRWPYADKTLILAAPGEEVISNRHGEADRFRADRAAGRIPAYAAGGTIPSGLPPTLTRGRNNDAEQANADAARAAKGLAGGLKAATKAVEAERKQRDALVQKMQQVATDVSGGLRTDLFGEGVDPWTSGGVNATLRADIGNARAQMDAIRELRRKGMSGPALAEILSQGGLAAAQAYSDMSRPELREYSRLFGLRNRVLRSVGDLAGNAAYGGALRESKQVLRRLERIEHAINQNGRNNREDHRQDRNANRKGAGDARRNRRRDR